MFDQTFRFTFGYVDRWWNRMSKHRCFVLCQCSPQMSCTFDRVVYINGEIRRLALCLDWRYDVSQCYLGDALYVSLSDCIVYKAVITLTMYIGDLIWLVHGILGYSQWLPIQVLVSTCGCGCCRALGDISTLGNLVLLLTWWWPIEESFLQFSVKDFHNTMWSWMIMNWTKR